MLYAMAFSAHLSAEVDNVKPQWQTDHLPAINEGSYMNIRLQATDKDSYKLAYQLLEGPEGLTLTKDGVMQFQPDFNAAGDHAIHVSVSDDEHTVEKQWTLHVSDLNRKPMILDNSPTVINEGDQYEYQPQISDADNDTINISIANAPIGLTIEKNSLFWQPNYEQADNYAFTLMVSDGKSTVEKNINIRVNNTNRQPRWVTDTLPVATENASYQVDLLATDDDNDVLRYKLVTGPKAMTIADNKLVWSPDFDASGKHPVTLSVSDSKTSVEKKWQLIVNNTNRKPQLILNAMPNAKEGDIYTLQIEANDKDGDRLSFDLSSKPSGMTLSKDGLIEWQPDFDSAGQHPIEISVSDGESEVSTHHILTVSNTNRAPAFKTLELEQATENSPYQASIIVKDPDADAVQLSLLEGPQGLFVNTQGQLEWLPDFTAAGNHPVQLQATDGSLTAKMRFELSVLNTNRKPEITSTPVTAAAEASPYQYAITSHDEDNDALAVELITSPDGMTLKNNQLIWQPTYNDAGSVDIELNVYEKNNKKAQSRQRFVIEVANTNRAPTWKTHSLKAAKEGVSYKTTLKADDADGQLVNYSLANGPDGLTLDSEGKLEWQPNYFQAGNYDLEFIADDGEIQIPLTLNIDVINNNRKPVITSTAMLEASENALYMYQISAFDADEESLDVSLLKAPKGLQLEGALLLWTPDFEQSGSHEVTIQATDGTDSVTQRFNVRVTNTNRLPIWQIPNDKDLTLKENSAWQLPLFADDADGQKIRYKLLTVIDGLKLSKDTLKWTPDFEQAGLHSIMVQAGDGENTEDLLLDISVLNTNRSPKITSRPASKVAENDLYHYALSAEDADKEDMDKLTFNILQAPASMDLLDAELSWRPDFESAGTHAVIMEVTDGENTYQQSFTIHVNNTNREPEFLSMPPLTVVEMSDYGYNIEVTDADKQPITLRLLDAPKGLTLANNTLKWSPDYYSAGTYSVKLSVSDGDLTSTQTFDIDVSNLNRLPVITSIPSKIAYENVDYRYALTATDDDAESLTFTLVEGPKGMRLSNDSIEWQPDYGQNGEHKIIVSVTDGIDTIHQKYSIVVQNTNREPTFAAIGEQEVLLGSIFSLPLEASDIDGTAVDFTLIHAPEGMVITEEKQLYWQPGINDKGKHTVIVSVSDGDLKVRRYFDLYVTQAD